MTRLNQVYPERVITAVKSLDRTPMGFYVVPAGHIANPIGACNQLTEILRQEPTRSACFPEAITPTAAQVLDLNATKSIIVKSRALVSLFYQADGDTRRTTEWTSHEF